MSKRLAFTLMMLLLTGVGLSACTPCDMIAPDLVSPGLWEILDPTAVVLNWNYTDSCTPDNFEIILSKDSSFSTIEHTGTVAGTLTSWTAPTLDDAEEYYWRVRGVDEGTNGPWSTQIRSFFTGPVCSAGELVAPSLVYPDFGGIYDNAYESLEWSWPLTTCIPESYRVEVSMGSPSFTDTTYNGGTGNPSTRWGFGSTPPAATQFWWRITPFADGAYGPTSLAKMFWTGPICAGGSLVAPEPVQPLNNDIVTIANPIFSWTYPDPSCAPEGMHLWISDTPDMSSIALDAHNPDIAALAFQAGITFDDCGEYYWQVAMISEGVEGPPSTKQRFIIDTGAGCACAPGSTTIPVQTGPGNYEILPDTDANLRWFNPGGCFPDGAAVQIATDHDFGDMNEFTFPGTFVSGYDPPGLDPATQYRWKAAFYMDDAGSPVIGDYSGPRSFFTGPECASLAEVVAPVRLSPADGSTVNTLTPALKYTPGTPGCIPDGYLLNLHMLPDLSDPNLLGEYTLPATTVVITNPLVNCQWYYWTVTAVQDSGYGPPSDVGSFYVDVDGTCTLPGMPATAQNNNFCREGTFPEHHKAIWTFEEGQHALAIARNPFSTYLKLIAVNQNTKQPFEPIISCWSVWSAFKPGWTPPDPPEGQYDFKDLPVEEPPPTPVPTKIPVCTADLVGDACTASGGKYYKEKKFCDCP
jgi:hypothetical protein